MDKIMGRTKWLIWILVLMMLLHSLQAQDEGATSDAPAQPDTALKTDEVETDPKAQAAKNEPHVANDGDDDLKSADTEKPSVSEKEVSRAANDDDLMPPVSDAPALTKVSEKDDNDLMPPIGDSPGPPKSVKKDESRVTNDGDDGLKPPDPGKPTVGEKEGSSGATNDGDDDLKPPDPGKPTVGEKEGSSGAANDGNDDLKLPDPENPTVGEKEGSSGATNDGNDDLMPSVGDSPGLTKIDEKDESRVTDRVSEFSEPDADTEQTTQVPIEESSKQPTPYDIRELEAFTENAGYPFNRPKAHHPGSRHVRAHDGFHNLKSEKHWAHWNDFLTSPRY